MLVVVRGLIAFFTLLIFTRILGKQQIGQLTFFDYALGITMGTMAATLTTDVATEAWPHWMGLATWTVAALALQLGAVKSRYMAKYVEGEPAVVIMNGQIMESAMQKMRYRATSLMQQLRRQGVFDMGEVEFAVLETSGQLSVLKKSQHQPVTPKDLQLSTNYSGLSVELICDGEIMEENLTNINLDRTWLEQQLQSRGITDPTEVFLAAINTKGELYIDLYHDDVKTVINTSDYAGPH